MDTEGAALPGRWLRALSVVPWTEEAGLGSEGLLQGLPGALRISFTGSNCSLI